MVTKTVADAAKELVELYKRDADTFRRERDEALKELEELKKKMAWQRGKEYRYAVGDHH